MPCIILNPTVSSYQYENCIFSQQSNCSPLMLYYRQDDYSNSISNLVVDIFSGSMDFSLVTIKSAVLELPVHAIHPHNRSFYNEIITTSYCTTSTIGPHAFSKISQPISPSSLSHDSFFIDVTSLLQQWNSKSFPVYQLILSIQKPNLYLEINNDQYVFPKLHIEYEDQASPSTDSALHPMAFLIETHCTQMMIEPTQPILFDEVNSEYISKISYSSNTGYFTFEMPGYYYLHWIINLRGSGSISTISISLINQSTKKTIAFHSPCVLPGQIYGQQVIHITDAPTPYALVNTSESALQLCNMSTQSSLVIFQL